MGPPVSRARAAIFPAASIALAAAVRFHAIGERSYWYDEGATLGFLRQPLGELFRHAWDPFLNNQVLYYLAIRPWHVFGEGEAAVRAFSAVFSVATVPVIYALVRRLFGATAGAIAAAALALHPFAVRYAQEARAYSFATFLVALSGLFLARYVESRARRDLVGWVVAGGLALYAHFFAGLAIAAQVVSLAALGPRRLRERKPLLAGAIVLAVLELPVAVFAVAVPKAALVDWVPPLGVARVAEVASRLAGGTALLLFPVLLALVLLATHLREQGRGERWKPLLILSWAVLPLLVMIAVSFRQAILVERYVFMSVPAVAAALGAAFGTLADRSRSGAVAAAAVLALAAIGDVAVPRWTRMDPDEDWRLVASEVAAATRPGDAVIFDKHWGGLTLEHYLADSAMGPEPLQRGNLLYDGTFDLEEAAARERVWIVLSRPDPARYERLLAWLRPTHPFLSVRRYPQSNAVVLLADTVRRDRGEGGFGDETLTALP